MPKILKPYTIIPPDLYVQRDADKQVKNIISDMGRPGYVLVSRQMGKTNLLLNAKRKLETAKDIFVYVDLSNLFPTDRGFFENIINIALETYPEKFQYITNVIFETRTELIDTPPHKQHTNELRLLLKALDGGKLIIILDEIDALTKTDYSDQIFSQIRSSYFASRVNYKEFYNLTYLLSGVIEPNEIIKNPKISPFNIGQKIYLNDFSKEEFDKFLIMANLNLSIELTDRIFYWTNGNPRMMWDVCSEVENSLKHRPITVEIIDKIVTDLYLTAFDKPPIDNIREIVKHDREIRNSIIEIEFKKGKNISDKVKSKLYLAGIINYDEDDIHIKNEIIRKSLSYDWVRKLEEEDKGLINIALEEYQDSKYSESLATFEKYLENNDFIDNNSRPHRYYTMGHCAFLLEKFDKAIQYFDKADFDVGDEAIWHFRTLNNKGLSYYYLNKYEESLECFKKIIESDKKDEAYARALLNYGAISLASNTLTHKDEAAKMFEQIISGTALTKEKLKDEVIHELKSIAHYNLAQTHKLNGERLKAIDNFKQAIAYSRAIRKPGIILEFLKIATDINEKEALLNQLIELITVDKIKPKDENLESPMDLDFSYDELKNVFIYTYLNFRESVFAILRPYLSLLSESEKSISKHLYDLAIFSINKNKDWDAAIKLLNEAYESFNGKEIDIDKETKYNTLKFLLAYSTPSKTSQSMQIEYLSMFEKERLAIVDSIDVILFANTISNLMEKKKYEEALKYVNLINSVKESLPESALIDYLIIYYYELNLHFYLNNKSKALSKAQEIISLAEGAQSKKQKSNLISDSDLDTIKQTAKSILHSIVQESAPIRLGKTDGRVRKPTPIRVGKTYGRNEIVKVRYKDGTTLETKFKRVADDIKTGACFILNEASIQQ